MRTYAVGNDVNPSKARKRRSTLWVLTTLAVLIVLGAGSWAIYWRHSARMPTVAGWHGWAVTIAGDGAPGWADGSVTTARFADPFGIAIARDGTIYVADGGNSNRIRRIGEGFVTTFAGGEEGFADGQGRHARFHTPSALAIDDEGNLLVADTGNHAIRKISPDARVTTIAGTGVAGYRDGPARQAQFDAPIGVAVDARGQVFVADSYNDRIRRIGVDGRVVTIAGAGTFGFADGASSAARFDTPSAVAVFPTGEVFIADTGNDAIRRIDVDGTVSTIAVLPGSHDALVRPLGLAITHDGFLYASARGRVVQIAPDGRVLPIAGAGPGWADGDGSTARFNMPAGLALDRDGDIYVAESGSYLIRRIRDRARMHVMPSSPGDDEARPGAGAVLPRPRLDSASLGIEALPWPLDPLSGPHELVGTLGEPRGSRGGDGRDRFHTGIDVSGVNGTIVRAVYDEKIRSPIAAGSFDALVEHLSAGIFTYMHIRVGRDRAGLPLDPVRFPVVSGSEEAGTRVRVRRGMRLFRGDPVGTINRFQHVQIDLGPSGAEINPLSIGIDGLADRVAPTIEPDGVRLENAAGLRLTEKARGRLIVREPVQIVVQAYDQVDGNRSRRKLGLYRLGYQILRADGTPADGLAEPVPTIEFDRLPPDPGVPHLAFAEGSGITVYGNRVTRMAYIVTNHVKGGRGLAGIWDATGLPPGDYIVRVTAADRAGNVAEARRDLPVTVAAAHGGLGSR
jgi:streptogramin lyase